MGTGLEQTRLVIVMCVHACACMYVCACVCVVCVCVCVCVCVVYVCVVCVCVCVCACASMLTASKQQLRNGTPPDCATDIAVADTGAYRNGYRGDVVTYMAMWQPLNRCGCRHNTHFLCMRVAFMVFLRSLCSFICNL